MMKRFFSLLMLAGVITSFVWAGDLRTWTNQKGQTIEAEILSLNGDTASLKMDNGRTYDVSLASLSAADVEFARKWKAEQEAIAKAPKPKSELLMTKPGKVLYHSALTEIEEGWKAGNGNWQAGENGLTGVEVAADDHAATFKRSLKFTTAIIEFDVLLGSTKGASFGIDDSSDHVCRVSLSPTGFQARKDDHDHEGPDKAKPFNKVQTELEPDEWYTVCVEIYGEEMLAQIDEEVSLGSDPLLAGEKTKCGFVVSGDVVGFRNLTIWEALPNEDWEKTGARFAA